MSIDFEIDRLKTIAARLEAVKPIGPRHDLVISRTVRVFGAQDLVWKWLCMPMLQLNDLTPLEAVIEDREADVLDLLRTMEYGCSM